MNAAKLASDAPHEGLRDKVALIRRYFAESLSHPSVRRFAESAIFDESGAPNLPAAFSFLRAKLRYLPDPVGAEYIKAPWVMVEDMERQGWASGDCDDFASLSYSLLRSLGVPAVLTVGWYDGEADPRHIWTRVPMKDRTLLDFDLVAPRIGVTSKGLTSMRDYA